MGALVEVKVVCGEGAAIFLKPLGALAKGVVAVFGGEAGGAAGGSGGGWGPILFVSHQRIELAGPGLDAPGEIVGVAELGVRCAALAMVDLLKA